MAVICKNCGHYYELQTSLMIKNKPSKQTIKKQSCMLYNKKYMIALMQITKNEIFTFIAVSVIKLLSRKVLFINRKDNGNC